MNLRNFGVIVSDRKQENSSSNYVEVDNVKAEVIPMFEENIKLNMGLSPGRSCLTESSDFRKKKEKIIKFEMINTPTMPLKGGVDK